jgi:hypothetical protein
MKRYVEYHHLEPHSFEPGNLVMLKTKNIQTRRPARKLKQNIYGPYDILDIISPMAVRLHLPMRSKIILVFHVSLIEPFIKAIATWICIPSKSLKP